MIDRWIVKHLYADTPIAIPVCPVAYPTWADLPVPAATNVEYRGHHGRLYVSRYGRFLQCRIRAADQHAAVRRALQLVRRYKRREPEHNSLYADVGGESGSA